MHPYERVALWIIAALLVIVALGAVRRWVWPTRPIRARFFGAVAGYSDDYLECIAKMLDEDRNAPTINEIHTEHAAPPASRLGPEACEETREAA